MCSTPSVSSALSRGACSPVLASLCACSSGTSSVGTGPAGTPETPIQVATTEPTSLDVRTKMHDAFVDEAQWTRLYIVAAYQHGADLPFVTTRLQQAEDAIAATLQPYYGGSFQSSLTALLDVRVANLTGLVTASFGNAAPVQVVSTTNVWFANADAIAQDCSRGRQAPNISLVGLQAQLHAEAQATLDQIDARSRSVKIGRTSVNAVPEGWRRATRWRSPTSSTSKTGIVCAVLSTLVSQIAMGAAGARIRFSTSRCGNCSTTTRFGCGKRRHQPPRRDPGRACTPTTRS